MNLQFEQHLIDRIASEGQFTSKEIEKRGAEAINIRLRANVPWISNLLRCLESKSPKHRARWSKIICASSRVTPMRGIAPPFHQISVAQYFPQIPSRDLDDSI